MAFGVLETLFSFWHLARPGLTLVAAILEIGLRSMIYRVVQITLSFVAKSMPARPDRVARGLDAAMSGPHARRGRDALTEVPM